MSMRMIPLSLLTFAARSGCKWRVMATRINRRILIIVKNNNLDYCVLKFTLSLTLSIIIGSVVPTMVGNPREPTGCFDRQPSRSMPIAVSTWTEKVLGYQPCPHSSLAVDDSLIRKPRHLSTFPWLDFGRR